MRSSRSSEATTRSRAPSRPRPSPRRSVSRGSRRRRTARVGSARHRSRCGPGTTRRPAVVRRGVLLADPGLLGRGGGHLVRGTADDWVAVDGWVAVDDGVVVVEVMDVLVLLRPGVSGPQAGGVAPPSVSGTWFGTASKGARSGVLVNAPYIGVAAASFWFSGWAPRICWIVRTRVICE